VEKRGEEVEVVCVMEFGFLFWFYFVGLFIVACQDLKRREIDDWLNLLMLVGGCVFVFYDSFLSGEADKIFVLAFLLLIMNFVSFIFYKGRVFAGGDAKLLFAMTPLFLVSGFWNSFWNAIEFVLFLMIVGSVYGMVYSGFLYFRNFKKVNKKMRTVVLGREWLLVFPLVIIFMGFWNFYFLLIGCWFLLLVLLLIFAKSLENVVMFRRISGDDLMEGDCLVEDVVVGGRVIKSGGGGLDSAEIKILKGKSVLIKDGIPFGLAFGLAFLFFWFFGGFVFKLVWVVNC
jgi:Flp pilus assembly protein protease CpaA